MGQCARQLTPVEIGEESICGTKVGQGRLMRTGSPQFSAAVKCRPQ